MVAQDTAELTNVGLVVFDYKKSAIDQAIEHIRSASRERRSPVISGPYWLVKEIKFELDLRGEKSPDGITFLPIEEEPRGIFFEGIGWEETAKAAGNKLRQAGVEYVIPITRPGWYHSRRCAEALRKSRVIPLPSGSGSITEKLNRIKARNCRSLRLHQVWWGLTDRLKETIKNIRQRF